MSDLFRPECAGASLKWHELCPRCGATRRDRCGDDAAYNAQLRKRHEAAGTREIAEISGQEIIIRVPFDALPVAAAVAWEGRSLRELKVTNIPVFATELVRQLLREKENGATLVTDMLDAAVIRAVEDGAEGFELGESPV